jgi:hypothetical protein
MADQHPQSLDPAEELWATIDWTDVFAEAGETLTSSAWTPSSEAVLDGQQLMDSQWGTKGVAIKLTGGVAGTSYSWSHIVTTTDASTPTPRTRKRKRTIIFAVQTK